MLLLGNVQQKKLVSGQQNTVLKFQSLIGNVQQNILQKERKFLKVSIPHR